MIRLLSERRATDLAIAHLDRIDPAAWPKNQLEDLAGALATAVPETPIELRNTPVFKQSLALARKLAPLLPAGQAAALSTALADLDLAVIRITTIPEKMLYDRQAFTVKAGKPVQIIFHNPDALPHNLVVAKPATSEAIAAAAVALGATGPDLHYIPAHDGILHHTRMLNQGETETLTFTAPAEPGDYDVVCTFPGHNLLLKARMRVME
jgi:azurin